jgi:Xaa-Pro aminopeptidase
MKAQKNETELEGFRKVMVRDGVAMVKFFTG